MRRYATPLIFHCNQYHLILGATGGNFYPRSGGGIFRRVVNQEYNTSAIRLASTLTTGNSLSISTSSR
jgi:hypothetical protein